MIAANVWAPSRQEYPLSCYSRVAVALIRRIIHLVTLVAESTYVYVILCCLPPLYSTRVLQIVHIVDGPSANDASQKDWDTILGDVISLSHAASGVGFSCICFGAYITQNSYESRPAMLGEILMLLGVYSFINAFVVFLYIKLIAKHTQIHNIEADEEGFVRLTATILAVPASSIIWCMVAAFVASKFYFGQSDALQVAPESYFDGQIISENLYTNTSSHQSTATTPSAPPPIAIHPFSSAETSWVVVAVLICSAQSLFVLYSIHHLRNFGNRQIESQSTHISSTTGEHGSGSHDDTETVEAR